MRAKDKKLQVFDSLEELFEMVSEESYNLGESEARDIKSDYDAALFEAILRTGEGVSALMKRFSIDNSTLNNALETLVGEATQYGLVGQAHT